MVIEKLAEKRGYELVSHQDNRWIYLDGGVEVQIYYFDALVIATIEEILLQRAPHVIFVFNVLKNQNRKKLDNYSKYGTFEVLVVEEIIHVLRGHQLIPPRFERVDSCKYPREQLPKMLSSDPIVKLYGYKVGDIIRVHRHDGRIYYRTVV